MIEHMERTPAQEIEPEAKFDAILIHGYWMSEHRTGLALRSRLATRAAALAYDEGKGARHIVLPLGKMWGEDYESTGNLMADELENKYDVPPQAIIREGNAFSTGGEVKTFLEIAQKNGWTKLLDVAFEQHLKTIPDAFKQYKGGTNLESVEQILRDNDSNTHIANLLDRLANSEFEADFVLYESLVTFGLKIPILNDYDRLEARNKKARTKKGKDSSLPIDVYRINGQRVEPPQRAMQVGKRIWPIGTMLGIVPQITVPKTS